MDENKDISQSARMDLQYDDLRQKVKERFRVKDADVLGISESKASRVLNKKQVDLNTLSKMASFCSIEVDLVYKVSE